MSKQYVDIAVNGVELPFEVDTGSPVVLLGEQYFRRYFADEWLSSSSKLYGASGEAVPVVGSFMATLGFGKKSGHVPVVVQAQERQIGLLGVPGLDVLFPGWRRSFQSGGEVNLLNKLPCSLKFNLSKIR